MSNLSRPGILVPVALAAGMAIGAVGNKHLSGPDKPEPIPAAADSDDLASHTCEYGPEDVCPDPRAHETVLATAEMTGTRTAVGPGQEAFDALAAESQRLSGLVEDLQAELALAYERTDEVTEDLESEVAKRKSKYRWADKLDKGVEGQLRHLRESPGIAWQQHTFEDPSAEASENVFIRDGQVFVEFFDPPNGTKAELRVDFVKVYDRELGLIDSSDPHAIGAFVAEWNIHRSIQEGRR